MKIKLFILLTVVSFFSIAQSWRTPFTPTISSVSSGFAVNENIMWLCGGKQSLYLSTDGGNTWNKKFGIDTTNYTASDVHFVNTNVGFAGCNYGVMLKTTDAGNTWEKLKIPDTTLTNTAIHFFDANLGYTLAVKGSGSSATSKIYKTIDGGVTWTTTASLAAAMLTLEFWSPTIGIATGNASNLYYTIDGSTWTKAPAPTFPPIPYSRTDQWALKFVSATTAYAGGWGSTAVGLEPSIYMKTTNAGATWTVLEQAQSNRVYVNIKSFYFKDEMNGFAVGGSVHPGTVICKTTDGGINWVPLSAVAGFTPSIVIGYNNTVIVSGGGGNIIKSTNFGDSWTMINKLPSETLYSIYINFNTMYASGTSGVFFKSTDLGKNFIGSYMTVGNVCLRSNEIFFINDNIGYVANLRGQVIKTTNAGTTWVQVMRDTLSTFVNNAGLYFINENIGFVAGKIAYNTDIIYKTTDGGQSWTSVQNIAFQDLNCVAFANANQGAAGGNKSVILFTTNQGSTWQQAAVNITEQIAINSIKFYDGLNGIAVGASLILKTTDGGATWNRISPSGFNISLSSVYAKDPTTFYITGSKYVLLSTDAGGTWNHVMDTVWSKQNGFTSINTVTVDKNGFVWIGAGGGFATNSPVTSVSDGEMLISSFLLEQNYPNPFNPSTKISFSLRESGDVSLKLFDVLGREVRDIFSGVRSVGDHEIIFNASGLASGTYIYTLKVNNQFTSRKMTLLK